MSRCVPQAPVPLTEAKEHLSSHGWSYRAAARQLGVSTQWLNDVLNGWRISRPLERRILRLGQCPEALMSARARNRMNRA